MHALSAVQIVSCLMAIVVSAAADTAKPVSAAEVSLEPLVGTTARLNQGNNSDQLKQLAAQLNALKEERRLLLQQRAGKQAELSSAQASGNAALAAQIKTRIDALQAKIDALENQIGALNSRIQSLQAAGNAGSAGAATTVPGVRPHPAAPMTARRTGAIPADKVKAAAATLARSPTPSLDLARAAAINLLAVHQPAYTNPDIDALVQVLLQQAAKDAAGDVRAQMAEMKKKTADKEAQREAAAAAKDSRNSLRGNSNQEQIKLEQLQDRQTRFEQLASEIAKKTGDTSDQAAANLK